MATAQRPSGSRDEALHLDIPRRGPLVWAFGLGARGFVLGARYVPLLVIVVIFVLPLAWMVDASLKPGYDVFQFKMDWVPNPVEFSNYPRALTFLPFWRFFLNTMFVTGFSLVGCLVSNTLIAYAFARLKARWREPLFYVVLATLMLPYAVTLIPQYSIYARLGLINTFWPLIIPNWFGNPFFIFLLRQFFKGIPSELEEACAIDGAGLVRTIVRIIVPLSWPALVTVTIFQVQSTWNDFLGPLVYLNSQSKYTLQVGLDYFITQHTGSWNYLMAATTVVVVPIIVLFYFGQRLFIRGIVLGTAGYK